MTECRGNPFSSIGRFLDAADGLINDHQIDIRPFAAGDRLHAAHLDRLIGIRSLVNALHCANGMNAFGLEGDNGLVDEAQRRDSEGDALPLVERALDDVSRGKRLAEAGRLPGSIGRRLPAAREPLRAARART